MDAMLNEWFEAIILKRACAVAASTAAAYFAVHGFHHWGIDITVHIQSETLRESLVVGITTALTSLHHWVCKKFPEASKWM